MHLRLIFGVLALALPHFAFTALPVHAATKTITATHTYVMGDSDSKEQARALCYLTAKRKVLDEAGVFVESSSEVKNFQLTKDQVNSYSAVILSVKVVKEDFGFANGVTTLTLTVQADVDMAEVKKRLAEVVADKGLQAKVDAQQQQIQKMEQQLQTLNQKLGAASAGAKEALRQDRDAELIAYARLAAERNEAEAQFYLGVMYREGRGVPQDDAQAVAWYRKAAAQGNADALYNLGWMYQEGRGVPQDDTQAATWYRKAAAQGEASASYMLGLLHEEGKGVPQDLAQAATWYRKAAEQGDESAQSRLGWMYRLGRGVPQDNVQAQKWFILAAAQGDSVASQVRDEFTRMMSTAQIAKAQRLAREWQDAFKKRKVH